MPKHKIKLYDDDDVCFCGHKYELHSGDDGDCEKSLGGYVGECPCLKFEKGY